MSSTSSRIFQEYVTAWAEHVKDYGPQTALLYQVGRFYELYDKENLSTGRTQANIRDIAEICQLSLRVSEPDADPGFQRLFGGFPDSAIAKYERLLVQAGYTVVIRDQRKNSEGDVTDHPVARIVSPGCYVEAGGRDRYLVGCTLESVGSVNVRVLWAAAALDIATGRIWFAEGDAPDRLHQFLCIHPPSELVLWSDGLDAAGALGGQIRQLCAVPTHVRCIGPASVAVDEALLDGVWAGARTRLEWIHRMPGARRCVAALIQFASEHLASALSGIALPEPWIPANEVRLGNAALEQLGVVRLGSGSGAGGSGGLLDVLDHCRSVAGRRLLRDRLMRPITDVAELRRRLALITTVSEIDTGSGTGNTELSLRSLYDMGRLWRRVELGTAGWNEMSCLLRSYTAASALLTQWSGPAHLQEYLAWVRSRWNIEAVSELAAELGGTAPPVSGLPWVAGTRPEVESVFGVGAAIRERAIALNASYSALGLREPLGFMDNTGGGFDITGTKRRVTAVQKHVPDSTVSMVQSVAHLETPAVSALSDEHRRWYGQVWGACWSAAWAESLRELCERGRGAHSELVQWCAELDVSWTLAATAREWCWVHPEFVEGGDDSFFAGVGMRHPIIERIINVPFVPHTLGLGPDHRSLGPDHRSLGPDRRSLGPDCKSLVSETDKETNTRTNGLLLYGINASGKSSLMKTVGLCVLMAQAGFPVPATSFRLTPFRSIFTRILGNDNLWAGMSSFVVEMSEFREILRFADAGSLVLGDELCSGTESLSATALVAAGVETLDARRAKFVFATHLHELATLTFSPSVRMAHLKVHYDASAGRLILDRHLEPGAGPRLYGLEVCRGMDLPAEFLERTLLIRQQLDGWSAAHRSVYSAGAVMDVCAICGSRNRLEMDHIVPQADAATAGFNIHAAGNLVCLCATCHDAKHAGELTIQGWTADAAGGRRLMWSRPGSAAEGTPANEIPDDVTAWVRTQRRTPGVRIATIQRLVKQQFGVSLTDKQIRALRS